MRREDIHIGDTLRVRQWNDLASEFDAEKYPGCIIIHQEDCDLDISFPENMRYLCGQEFTVSRVVRIGRRTYYRSYNNIELKYENDFWRIVAEMLEPFIEEDLEVANDEDIKLLFG